MSDSSVLAAAAVAFRRRRQDQSSRQFHLAVCQKTYNCSVLTQYRHRQVLVKV